MEINNNNKNDMNTYGSYDVIVIGGGIAGVSAAVASRRQGMHTLLVEKSVMLGGLATLGNIAFYLPLCDGKGRQVAGGLAEELLYESIRYGYGNLDSYWNKTLENRTKKRLARYETIFSPPEFIIALDELIVKEGVDLILDAVLSQPVMDDKKCKGVFIETKMGQKYFEASAFIDGTGDGDLFIRAGADYRYENNWLACWAYSVSFDSIKEALEKQDIRYAVNLEVQGGMNGKPSEDNRVYSLNEITKFILDGRQMLKKNVLSLDKKKKTLVNLPGMPQLRTTCRLIGEYNLTEADYNRKFEDSIGVIGDWRSADIICEIPYRALISSNMDNIFVAGRCIASSGDAWEITRVIPTAAVTGEAAGIAAAEAIKSKKSAHEINVKNVQTSIEKANGRIHY